MCIILAIITVVIFEKQSNFSQQITVLTIDKLMWNITGIGLLFLFSCSSLFCFFGKKFDKYDSIFALKILSIVFTCSGLVYSIYLPIILTIL